MYLHTCIMNYYLGLLVTPVHSCSKVDCDIQIDHRQRLTRPIHQKLIWWEYMANCLLYCIAFLKFYFNFGTCTRPLGGTFVNEQPLLGYRGFVHSEYLLSDIKSKFKVKHLKKLFMWTLPLANAACRLWASGLKDCWRRSFSSIAHNFFHL